MKTITATAVILCTAAVAWGQQSNSASQGPDRDTVAPKGNRIHHLLSAPAEAQRRAQEAPVGFAATGTNLVYGGSGPVMRNPTNYLIFWQPPSRAAFRYRTRARARLERNHHEKHQDTCALNRRSRSYHRRLR